MSNETKVIGQEIDSEFRRMNILPPLGDHQRAIDYQKYEGQRIWNTELTTEDQELILRGLVKVTCALSSCASIQILLSCNEVGWINNDQSFRYLSTIVLPPVLPYMRLDYDTVVDMAIQCTHFNIEITQPYRYLPLYALPFNVKDNCGQTHRIVDYHARYIGSEMKTRTDLTVKQLLAETNKKLNKQIKKIKSE